MMELRTEAISVMVEVAPFPLASLRCHITREHGHTHTFLPNSHADGFFGLSRNV